MTPKRTPSSKVRIDPSHSPSNKHAYIILVLVLLGVAILHAQNLNDGFLIDDAALIKTVQIFVPGQFSELLRPDMDTYWRPVFKLFFVPFALIFKYSSPGYHILSLILHLVCIGLLYGIARRFLSKTWAATATAIFALHPLHVGTIAWISAGYDLLATTFVLACCMLYLRSLVSFDKASRIGALVFMALAFLTKEVAFVTPILLFALATFFGPSSLWLNLSGRIKGLIPFFLLAVLLIGIRIGVMGTIGGPGGHTGHPELLHPEWSTVFANYIQIFPDVFQAPINRAALGTKGKVFTIINHGLTGLGWLILVGLLWFRKRRETWVGLGFTLVACAPLSFFAVIGPNLESGYMLYLALAGFSIFVATIASLAAKSSSTFGKVFLAGLALWGIALLPMSWLHARAYSVAGKMGDAMRQGIVQSIGNEAHIGPVYCQDFPGQFHGVRLFYDRVDQLLWPVMDPVKPETILLADENLLLKNSNLLPFREAAGKIGFRHLKWEKGEVVDHTAQTVAALKLIEDADTEERMFLKIPDSDPQTWHMSPPTLAIEAPDVIPASSITRLCLEMSLRSIQDQKKEKPGYALTWTLEEGAFTANLPYAPSADGFTCAYLDRDPRFALGNELSELFVTPHALAGRIKISQAEIVYRTKKLEIFEELILQPGDPLFEMLAE